MNSPHPYGSAKRNGMDRARIFTVTEINASIRGLLESQFPFVSVSGEISNLRQPLSGHLYFTLKDEQSQIKAVLFKMQQRYLAELPADGRMVVCRGRISVYEPRGDYQLIVDAIDLHGTGILQLEFEQLKNKLAAEGLFDRARKKNLPLFPEHITLVTSPRGAAVHDFIRIAQRRYPLAQLAVFPVAVQGDQAAADIIDALASINSTIPASIIVLCRGGGSLEDLRAFNDEKVARAIAGSRLPVVSAVGHEVDFTIADFVADLRAPTPSGAAEMILPDCSALKSQVNQFKQRLLRKMSARLDRFDHRLTLSMHQLGTMQHPIDRMAMQLDHIAGALERAMRIRLTDCQASLGMASQNMQRNNPLVKLEMQQQRLTELHRRLLAAGRSTIKSCDESLSRAAGLLDAVSPLSTLARGYSIVRKALPDGSIVSRSVQVTAGGRIDVILHEGYLECLIEKTGQGRLRRKN